MLLLLDHVSNVSCCKEPHLPRFGTDSWPVLSLETMTPICNEPFVYKKIDTFKINIPDMQTKIYCKATSLNFNPPSRASDAYASLTLDNPRDTPSA